MIEIVLVIRELGNNKPDYSLDFALPEVPRVGDYVSIHRPDKPEPFSEDVVVRHVWWRLEHPETGSVSQSGEQKRGRVAEIIVECDPALGPYASDNWRKMMLAARDRGVEITEFDVARFSVRESDLSSS